MAVPNLTRTDAAARAELLTLQSYDLQLDVTDGAGHPGAGTFRSTTTVEFSSRQAGAATFIDLVAETGPLGHPQRRRTRRQQLHRGRRAAAARPGRAEHAGRHRRLPLLQQRGGAAPLHRPGGRAGLPLHPVRAGRRQADVRLLRPARPQGGVHAARRRALRLAGHLQHRRPHHRGRRRRDPSWSTSRRPSGSRPTSSRSSPAPTPGSPTRTTASRWASTAGRRWRSTWTPTRSSPSPSRASTSSTGSSTTRTRSTSTTSSSCPSSTPGPWRTPGR